ncbi:scarecrow-like protein 6 [Abeliophyllum distichum]|uniref:Scarecrow-like protein 6 n=1 Tax=Abeliophyllum distichum TaxID=126358 RepID=A0ABD1VCM7_9LAMI
MEDVENLSIGSLNKVLQIGSGPLAMATTDIEFNDGFGVVDQTFGVDSVGQFGVNFISIVLTLAPSIRLSSSKSCNGNEEFVILSFLTTGLFPKIDKFSDAISKILTKFIVIKSSSVTCGGG